MNESSVTPAPVATSPRQRRRLALPAVVAALALGGVGIGIGHATVNSRQSAARSGQGTTSTQAMQPAFNGPYRQSYGGGGHFTDPNGDSTTSPDEGYSPDNGTQSQDSNSSDSTAQASGSQLTGLVRIVSTNSYTGSEGVGTGLVLTSDGEVVTNHHVVEGATSVKVTVMSTGNSYTSHVAGTDATDDVAVIELDNASGLDTVTTDTSAVSVGDAVTAVGDGNGTENYLSAATGSVMATDQPVTTQDEGTASSESLTGLIEISSDVVPGYSGGATYDADGAVIGMTTAATSNTQDPDGYAIPIATVLEVAQGLTNGVANADYDYAQPAFLGIGLGSGTGTTVQGAYDGTPAALAGVGAGDRITSVGGTDVQTATRLRNAIAAHSPGDKVNVSWADTSGSSHSATVTLVEGPVE